MSAKRRNPYSARMLYARRRSAVETGTIIVELHTSHEELKRCRRWRFLRRAQLTLHVRELELLVQAYGRGGRDAIGAKAAIEGGWRPPGVQFVRGGRA